MIFVSRPAEYRNICYTNKHPLFLPPFTPEKYFVQENPTNIKEQVFFAVQAGVEI